MPIFRSTSHQRFEQGRPVQGLQICNRDIEIKRNENGCKGYNLKPNDGYIVTIYISDGVHPLWQSNVNMSPKPMRVIRNTPEVIELRGYPVEAMTPFGWIEIDQSDYGITLHIDSKQITKCTLHMFDRNIDIEYYK